MSESTLSTTNRDTIRKRAEARGGKPATVKSTGNGDAGLLRLNFPGFAEDNPEDISWDDFFQKFEEKKLAMIYQEKNQYGNESRFFKFVD